MSIYVHGMCHNYRTEVEEYESTAVYRTLLFHNSCFLRTVEKNTLNLLLTFFVFIKVLLNCVFPHISHIYQCSIIACSIINFAIILFYNSGFYVHSFGVPEKCIK